MATTIELQRVGTFSTPIDVAAPLHEDHLLFVVEQAGRVRVLRDGALRPEPFLDISGLVDPGPNSGLLSIAFPPRYWQTGRFVVYYVDRSGSIQIAEYRRSQTNPELADPLSARPLLRIVRPIGTQHYGGAMEFGADGLLYIGTGDGGGQGDPEGNAQNLGSLLGKLLRIDPFAGEPYAIPPGNPFVGVTGARPEIFAYGFRNPWRFSFDRETGDLVIGDVGQSALEEVDAVRAPLLAGLNFGWSVYEASSVYRPGTAPGAVSPVFEYPHTDSACSIIGGVVVRDPSLTTLVGRYLYRDWCGNEIHSLVLGWPTASDEAGIGLEVSTLVSFGEDAGACIYAVALAGGVYRLAASGAVAPVPCPDTPPETTVTAASSTSTSVSFGFASSEAGSSFECRLDAGDWSACSSPVAYTLAAGSHRFDVRAGDPGGTVDPTPATAPLTVIAAAGGDEGGSGTTPQEVAPIPTSAPAPSHPRRRP